MKTSLNALPLSFSRFSDKTKINGVLEIWTHLQSYDPISRDNFERFFILLVGNQICFEYNFLPFTLYALLVSKLKSNVK